jgi:hypothetical protein
VELLWISHFVMPDLIEQAAMSGGHGGLLNGIHLPSTRQGKKVDPGSSPG